MKFKLKTKNLIEEVCLHFQDKLTRTIDTNQVENIKIALGEVLQNIIRHGYKSNLSENDFIDIEYFALDAHLVFVLRDYAKPCEVESFLNKNFTPNESGQMGLSIIRKLTDEFTIKPLQDGNETKLIFKIEKLE
jgi:anti-sigma regulatory factor (Ser/Thr protein kinase)